MLTAFFSSSELSGSGAGSDSGFSSGVGSGVDFGADSGFDSVGVGAGTGVGIGASGFGSPYFCSITSHTVPFLIKTIALRVCLLVTKISTSSFLLWVITYTQLSALYLQP